MQLSAQAPFSWRVVCPPGPNRFCHRQRPAVLACAGISALTTLSNLTRLGLQGDGFGIGELAMKVSSFVQNSLHRDLRID